MKLTPLADRVVLKMTEAEETTKGGIILTGGTGRRPHLLYRSGEHEAGPSTRRGGGLSGRPGPSRDRLCHADTAQPAPAFPSARVSPRDAEAWAG